jgi:hypothetical protein
MGAADNPVGHDNRLGSGFRDECQHFFRHPDVVADLGLVLREPASKVGRLGVLGRHDADRELGRRAIVRAVERDRCDRPAAKSFLGPFAQSFAGALDHCRHRVREDHAPLSHCDPAWKSDPLRRGIGVAGEIGQNALGAAEGRLGVDDEGALTQRARTFGERGDLGEWDQGAEETEFASPESGFQAVEDPQPRESKRPTPALARHGR